MCWQWRMIWKACWIIVHVVVSVQCYENVHLLVIFVNMSFPLVWDMAMTSVMCIEKEWKIKEDVPFRGSHRMPRWILYFEGRIPCRNLLLFSRVVSCISTNAWTDLSLMGPGLRDNVCVSLCQTCIIIFDIAFRCMAHTDHYWTWYCVLLILWMPLCGIGDWWILSLLLRYIIC